MPTVEGHSDARSKTHPRLHRAHGRAWVRDYAYALRRQLNGPLERHNYGAFLSGSRAPVLLLAGVLEPWTMLLPVARRLHAAGHPVHVEPKLALNRATVPAAARMASAAVRARDLHDLVLVAHSKGGLVGKRMLIDDTEGRLAGLIAIATPFHGSSLASLLPTPAISALHPSDPTIRELASHREVNSRITSIYPAFDPHVPESSHLEGASNIEVRAMGHFLVLDDREVLDAVVAAAEELG